VVLVDKDANEAVLGWKLGDAEVFLGELLKGPAGCELSLPIRSGIERAAFFGDELLGFVGAFEVALDHATAVLEEPAS
jgi:hypothetical protein